MLSFIQFVWYAMRMRRSYEVAERAQKAGDGERAFQFLRKARQAGCAALNIQSAFVPRRLRMVVKKNLVVVHGLYQRGVIARIPEEDLELVVSALKHIKTWADMDIAPNVSQVVAVIKGFESAKYHVNQYNDVEALRLLYVVLYDGSESFSAPLRNIMQPFFAGEATREETEKRLDECVEKLQKWLPEIILFSEELHPQ